MNITFKMFLLLFLFLLTPSYALANIPILPVIYLMDFTIISIFRTSGIALIALILIESLILNRITSIGILRSVIISFAANIFSTLAGLLIAITYSSSWFIFLFIPLGLAFSMMLDYSTSDIDSIRNYKILLSAIKISIYVILFIAPVIGVLTVPGHNYWSFVHNNDLMFQSNISVCLAIIAAFIILFFGFILTVISETYCIRRMFKYDADKIPIITVIKINAVSYVILILTSSFYIATSIMDKTWFLHR